ncbi:hypothetical protein DL771_009223 [Monosporascus sp. 5C6A]|nr:hypothetical protein DL771_009223 [Monosporascus sp. 5C6A]
MDDFNSEFHYRVKKVKGDRDGNDKSKNQSHNARGRNGNNKGRNNNNNNNNNNGDKRSWNAKGEPLCWNCGKYGHLSKDCRKPRKDGQDNRNQNGQRNNGRNGNGNRSNNNGNNGTGNSNNANSQQQRQPEAHFIPDGLEDLYNLPAKKHQAGYAAAVDQSDMAEIMQLFDRAMEQQRQTASPQGTRAPKGAVAPEGVASGGSTPGVSTPCSASSQHPELPEEIGSTGSTAEKLEARGAKGLSLGYQGTHNYKVWLLEGGRFLITPYIRVYEEIGALGEKDEPPDLREVVRSLPPYVQRRLRHRPRKKDVGVHNRDDNVVSDDQTDDETKTVKRKRGRPKKVKPELYTCEAPDEDPEIMKALIQEGADPHPGVHSLNFFDESEDEENSTVAIRQAYERMHVQNVFYIDEYLFNVDGDGPTLKEVMENPEWDMWLKVINTEIGKNL